MTSSERARLRELVDAAVRSTLCACEYCGKRLPENRQSNRRFCGQGCRARAWARTEQGKAYSNAMKRARRARRKAERHG